MSTGHLSRPDRVLVTGAGGFIGAHLVADLAARGVSVVALDLRLDRLAELASELPIELLHADVGDPEQVSSSLEGVDRVFHLAATHLSLSASEAEYDRVNVEATRELALRSLEAGVRRFVHCSTVGVFGRIDSPPADEESPCDPEFAYERTKLAGEEAVLRVHSEKGLAVTVLRPAWVYGPGCPRTLKLFTAIRKGRFLVAGRGEGFRHGLYIRDMLRTLDLASRVDESIGKVVIVADDEPVTVRTLVNRIAEITGAPPPPSVPYPLLLSAGALVEFVFRAIHREPPLSRRTLRFFSGNAAFSTERARKVLGFQPAYDLTTGLRETHEAIEEGLFWSLPLSAPSPQPRS